MQPDTFRRFQALTDAEDRINIKELLKMARHYRKTFIFCDTMEQAKTFCDTQNANVSAYIRRKRPAHFTPWNSQDGREKKYICWYCQ